jgi:hypothetical protein
MAYKMKGTAMALCTCGCNKKIRFGRSYMNRRATELFLLNDFVNFIVENLKRGLTHNSTREEQEGIQNELARLRVLNLMYATVVHSFSVGDSDEKSLPVRSDVWNTEMEILACCVYCGIHIANTKRHRPETPFDGFDSYEMFVKRLSLQQQAKVKQFERDSIKLIFDK